MKERLIIIIHWMTDRLLHIPERDRFVLPSFIGFGLMTTITAIIYALGYPTGNTLLAHGMNISKIVAINGLLFIAASFILSAVFSFIYLPVPRIFLANFSYTLFSSITVLLNDSSGKLFSIIVGTIYSILAVIISLVFVILFHKKIKRIMKLVTLSLVLFLVTSVILFIQHKDDHIIPAIPANAEKATVENPGNKGAYDYTFFTYGSGEDLRREWFGKEVDELTPSVDSSHFITKWGKKRKKFWGFDQKELPINGRVWIPEGDGPFPVVLMVHGNHTMEYFSTSGYDYLGELLASRGFIAISVDEDFINYSNVSGSPNRNYELRAWMIMQHLAQLQEMYYTPGSIFYHKIDFDQVGLMGHSRGGQAVPMVADYMTFFGDFEDDELLDSMENITIQGIVAIAPTDRQIKDEKPYIHNISYLLMHGAKDADVSDFSNDRQFYRATFDPQYDGFRASVYIEGANHTQFNTDWGQMDLSLPRGLFLNQKQTLKAEQQQKVAKVYMAAFFESVFHKNKLYEKLFENHQYGRDWLPDTTLVTKYKHASYKPIVRFYAGNKVTGAEGFRTAKIITPKYRRGSTQTQDALQLHWEKNASFTFDVSDVDFTDNKYISLIMANNNGDEDKYDQTPEIEIELETKNKEAKKIPLHDYIPFPPVISTDYTHFGLFDSIFREERYKNSWEPVFQTFNIPLESFKKDNFNIDQINKITLHFRSNNGDILIEEIGLY